MHPYREHGDAHPTLPAEDRAIYVLFLAAGVLRVALALAGGETFGGEATLAMLLAIFGGWGLIRRSH